MEAGVGESKNGNSGPAVNVDSIRGHQSRGLSCNILGRTSTPIFLHNLLANMVDMVV